MRKLFLIGLLVSAAGCTGTSAVSPLSPKKAQAPVAPGGEAKASAARFFFPDPTAPTATARTFYDLEFLTAEKAVACSGQGKLWRWEKESWKPWEIPFPVQEDLYALSFFHEKEGVVVGQRGVILTYRNGEWKREASPTTENLFAVKMVGPGRAFAAGENGVLLSFESGGWRIQENPAGDRTLFALSFSDAMHGWAAGEEGVLLRYQNGGWALFEPSPTTEALYGVSASSDVSAFACGAFGVLLRFNGTLWTRMENPRADLDLFDLFVQNDAWGFAVGREGVVLHFDGLRWLPMDFIEGKPTLHAVAFWNEEKGFAAGEKGTLVRYSKKGKAPPAPLDIRSELERTEKGLWRLICILRHSSSRPLEWVEMNVTLPETLKVVDSRKAETPSTPQAGGGTLAAKAASFVLPMPASTIEKGKWRWSMKNVPPNKPLTLQVEVSALKVFSEPLTVTGVFRWEGGQEEEKELWVLNEAEKPENGKALPFQRGEDEKSRP